MVLKVSICSRVFLVESAKGGRCGTGGDWCRCAILTRCCYSMNQSENQISYSESLTGCCAESRCRGLALTKNASATTESTSCVGIWTKQTRSRGCGSVGRTKGTCTPAKPRGASSEGTKASSRLRCTEDRGCRRRLRRALSKATYDPKISTCSAKTEEKTKTLNIPKGVVVVLAVPRLPNIGFAGCCCWG